MMQELLPIQGDPVTSLLEGWGEGLILGSGFGDDPAAGPRSWPPIAPGSLP